MKLCYKVWLDNEGKAFGKGPFEILWNVKELGSLREAAKEMGISYSKAWKTINMVEERLGITFIYREIGGPKGGGSYLTEEGKGFLEKYGEFTSKVDEELRRLFMEYFENRSIEYG